MKTHVLAASLLAVTIGCASTGPERPRRDRNVISAEEIAAAQVTNAFDAVRRLRPHFLQSRGPSSIQTPGADQPVVYMNGMRVGSPETLDTIRANEIETITYISPSDATTRYGTGHAGGVIEVKTKS